MAIKTPISVATNGGLFFIEHQQPLNQRLIFDLLMGGFLLSDQKQATFEQTGPYRRPFSGLVTLQESTKDSIGGRQTTHDVVRR